MRHIFTAVILLFIASCAHSPKTSSYACNIETGENGCDADEHILRVNSNGYIIDSEFATLNYLERDLDKILSKKTARNKIDNMILESIKLACRKSQVECEDFTSIDNITMLPRGLGKVKILLYVHGGLNTYDATDKRLENQLSRIESEETDWHYPIYVSWPSNALGTVNEHLFHVREGRQVNPLVGVASSIGTVWESIFTGIGKAPANVADQFINDKDRFASGVNNEWLSSVWKDAEYQYKSFFFEGKEKDFCPSCPYVNTIDNITINRSTYNNTGFSNGLESAFLVVVSPVRYVIGIPWNGTLANNAWDMMKRRARAIANPNGEYNKHVRERFGSADKEVDGSGIGYLLERLFKLENEHPDLNVSLTLVGHSMGAIVINNILNRYQKEFSHTNYLDSIVYMGAAASIAETLAVIPPIMRENERQIDFYNLTLNRVAEVAETHYLGFAPSGSLLVSIDKYHDSPEHHLLRTLGSEVNVQSSLETIVHAFKGLDGDRVVLKAFDKNQKILPFRHGDFGDLSFWKKETWQIDSPELREEY